MKDKIIIILLLISIKETFAQTNQAQLNQVELMKLFIGNWECELGKNTIYRSDNKPFGTGMARNIQIINNADIIDPAKQLFGYYKQDRRF